MAIPSSHAALVHAAFVLLGDESNQGTYLTKKYCWPFFAELLFQLDQSFLIQFVVWLQSVSAQSKGNERWEHAGKSGSSGIWKLCKWSLAVQWLNIEPRFGTETFCLPCLLNCYCMWCSINNVFWNYCKAILKEKYSYWISTVIYLPALLPSQSPAADHLIYVFNKCETEYSTAFLPVLK